jgi:hypothetical protein
LSSRNSRRSSAFAASSIDCNSARRPTIAESTNLLRLSASPLAEFSESLAYVFCKSGLALSILRHAHSAPLPLAAGRLSSSGGRREEARRRDGGEPVEPAERDCKEIAPRRRHRLGEMTFR